MKPQYNHLKTFAAIKAFMRQKQYPPSLKDLMELTGVRSPGTICRHLITLQDEGCIRHNKHTQRSIVLTGIEPDPHKEEPVLVVKINQRSLFAKPKRKAPRLNEKPLPRLTKAQLDARVEMVAKKAQSNPQAAYSEDAKMKVLPNGIKVIIRTPSLWGSKAHQAG